VGRGGRPRLGVVGSCNVDLVVATAALPRPGETVLGADVERLPGGKGANQAAAAATLGADVTLLACVGADDEGDWLVAGLRARGVDVSRVSRSPRPSGAAFITVAVDGENQIVVSPGANRELDLADAPLEGFDVVLASMEVDPSVIGQAATRARRLVLNAAPAGDVDAHTLRACAAVIVNEVESARLDVASLARCVVTLGADGAVHLARGSEVARSRPPVVEVVDTVGAGDVFCAAYGVALAEGMADQAALDFAVAAGALATRARGAQGALPTRAQVEECRR
jgi:ribokinase